MGEHGEISIILTIIDKPPSRQPLSASMHLSTGEVGITSTQDRDRKHLSILVIPVSSSSLGQNWIQCTRLQRDSIIDLHASANHILRFVRLVVYMKGISSAGDHAKLPALGSVFLSSLGCRENHPTLIGTQQNG
jgi:hypothetical protein